MELREKTVARATTIKAAAMVSAPAIGAVQKWQQHHNSNGNYNSNEAATAVTLPTTAANIMLHAR